MSMQQLKQLSESLASNQRLQAEQEEELGFMPGSDEFPEMQKKEDLPYEVKRRVMYEGQFAPKGQIFLCLYFKTGSGKSLTKWKLKKRITGNLGPEAEAQIAAQMYKQFKEKYKL